MPIDGADPVQWHLHGLGLCGGLRRAAVGKLLPSLELQQVAGITNCKRERQAMVTVCGAGSSDALVSQQQIPVALSPHWPHSVPHSVLRSHRYTQLESEHEPTLVLSVPEFIHEGQRGHIMLMSQPLHQVTSGSITECIWASAWASITVHHSVISLSKADRSGDLKIVYVYYLCNNPSSMNCLHLQKFRDTHFCLF